MPVENKMRNSESTLRDRIRSRPFAGEEADRERNSKWRTARQHGVAMCGEFVGTTMFLWFSFAGAQTAAATGGVADTSSQVMLTSLSFGFALLVTVWAFYRISGGLFNPAVGDRWNSSDGGETRNTNYYSLLNRLPSPW